MIRSKTSVPVFILERTSKKMKHAFQRVLKKWNTDLTADQWVVLQCLHVTDGLTQYEIGLQTYKDAPTLTRIIDKLVRKSLVYRKTNDEDRRKLNIFLTKDGQKKISDFLPKVIDYRKKIYANLSDEEIEDLLGILNTIHNNIL